LTTVNCFGVKKTALVTRAIVAVVLTALGAVIAGVLFGGELEVRRLAAADGATVYGVLQAAGLLFFAFAGYARLATLGEVVIEPGKTIPRAIPLALGITLGVYTIVAVSALLAVGAPALASSPAPLATAVEAGELAWLSPAVRLG